MTKENIKEYLSRRSGRYRATSGVGAAVTAGVSVAMLAKLLNK